MPFVDNNSVTEDAQVKARFDGPLMFLCIPTCCVNSYEPSSGGFVGNFLWRGFWETSRNCACVVKQELSVQAYMISSS